MIKWYCEDGEDHCISIHDRFKDAKEYANKDSRVMEIHKYKYIGGNNPDDIKYLGCYWNRPGWDGFEMTDNQ